MRNSKQNKSVAKVASKKVVTTSRKQVKSVAKLTKTTKPVAKASKPAKTVKPAARVTKKITPVAKQVQKMTVVSSRTRRTESKSVVNKILSLRDRSKMTYPEIAAELTKAGLKSSNGKLFTNRTVRYQYDTAK